MTKTEVCYEILGVAVVIRWGSVKLDWDDVIYGGPLRLLDVLGWIYLNQMVNLSILVVLRLSWGDS